MTLLCISVVSSDSGLELFGIKSKGFEQSELTSTVNMQVLHQLIEFCKTDKLHTHQIKSNEIIFQIYQNNDYSIILLHNHFNKPNISINRIGNLILKIMASEEVVDKENAVITLTQYYDLQSNYLPTCSPVPPNLAHWLAQHCRDACLLYQNRVFCFTSDWQNRDFDDKILHVLLARERLNSDCVFQIDSDFTLVAIGATETELSNVHSEVIQKSSAMRKEIMAQTAFDDPSGIIQNHVLSGRLLCNNEFSYQFGAESLIPHDFDFTSDYQTYLELDNSLFMKKCNPEKKRKLSKSGGESTPITGANLALKLNVSSKKINPIFSFLDNILC